MPQWNVKRERQRGRLMNEEHASAMLAVAARLRLVSAEAARAARVLEDAPAFVRERLDAAGLAALVEARALEAEVR